MSEFQVVWSFTGEGKLSLEKDHQNKNFELPDFSDFQRLAVILKIDLVKDNLTQMTCKHVNGTFPGPKSGFCIIRMNQCEVSDQL